MKGQAPIRKSAVPPKLLVQFHSIWLHVDRYLSRGFNTSQSSYEPYDLRRVRVVQADGFTNLPGYVAIS